MSYQTYRDILLKTASDSIQHGLLEGSPLSVHMDDYPEALREKRASFVTLELNQQLRGCIGMLEARRPLIEDIAENAFAAAFRDPRFLPLNETEFPLLEIHLSILHPAQLMSFATQEDLVSQLRPGEDGLILEDLGRRGTFLPSVWESLPSPEKFIQHLKMKAGFSAEYWSDTLKVYRYTTEVIK